VETGLHRVLVCLFPNTNSLTQHLPNSSSARNHTLLTVSSLQCGGLCPLPDPCGSCRQDPGNLGFDLNFGPLACTVPFKPCPIPLCFIYFSDKISHFCSGPPLNIDPSTYAFHIAGIAGVIHHALPSFYFSNLACFPSVLFPWYCKINAYIITYNRLKQI
jgi:hypothetical protein